MKFCLSTLKVMDLEESIKFYKEIIGLPVVSRFFAGPGVEIAFLGSGETKIELICGGGSRETDIGEPMQPNSKTRFFFIEDPNGMRIQLIENLE